MVVIAERESLTTTAMRDKTMEIVLQTGAKDCLDEEDDDLEQANLDKCYRGCIEIPRSSSNILRLIIGELITGTKTVGITVLYLAYASVRCSPAEITMVVD